MWAATLARAPPGTEPFQDLEKPRMLQAARCPVALPSELGVPSSGACGVKQLQQFVGGKLDVLVTPLGRPVVARDQAHAVHATEVPVYERVSRLRLVRGAVREPEVPLRVVSPRV